MQYIKNMKVWKSANLKNLKSEKHIWTHATLTFWQSEISSSAICMSTVWSYQALCAKQIWIPTMLDSGDVQCSIVVSLESDSLIYNMSKVRMHIIWNMNKFWKKTKNVGNLPLGRTNLNNLCVCIFNNLTTQICLQIRILSPACICINIMLAQNIVCSRVFQACDECMC